MYEELENEFYRGSMRKDQEQMCIEKGERDELMTNSNTFACSTHNPQYILSHPTCLAMEFSASFSTSRSAPDSRFTPGFSGTYTISIVGLRSIVKKIVKYSSSVGDKLEC
jgi:hypothetical protein